MTGFGGSGLFPTEFVSKSVMLNDGAITRGKFILDESQVAGSIADMAFFLSANGGTNWEQVSNGVDHTFTNTGSDLKYRIVALNVTLSIDSGVDVIPINVIGNSGA